MGNGLPSSFLCCNLGKNQNIEDIDLNKNSKEYVKNYMTIKMNNNDFKKDFMLNNNDLDNKNSMIKKMKTYYKSAKTNSKKIGKLNRGDSNSNKEPSISLFNNTFQILNNTQQYISFSNIHFFKNNLMNNQNMRSYFTSKLNSGFNLSKIEENMGDVNINTKLMLTGELFSNKVLEIDKFGMKNSPRKKSNGVVIFGIINNDNLSTNDKYDYTFNLRLLKEGNQNKNYKPGNLFQIFLDIKEKIFLLYFTHKSLLLYYKINNDFFFEPDKEYYLIMGDIFLTINVKRNFNTNEQILNIEVEAENEKSQKYTFKQTQTPITIGRLNCTINIPKPSISKNHSKIQFANDSFFYQDVKSTNGSTLLIKEDDVLKIRGEMNFKLEDIPFKIKEIVVE